MGHDEGMGERDWLRAWCSVRVETKSGQLLTVSSQQFKSWRRSTLPSRFSLISKGPDLTVSTVVNSGAGQHVQHRYEKPHRW